ncbi:MAG: sulfotransferase domain-containing protein [Rhizomicrobium sp.]
MALESRQDSPLTWLASYPRSGNTLLRIVLKRCFGLASQSVYDDVEFSDATLRDVVGHEPVGDDPARFLQQAQEQHRHLYVKTHELPPADRHPVIYVVRDGRAAVVSYLHFLREILKRNVTPRDVICGTVGTSWSRHVRAWTLPPRPGTLIVRYEDLAIGEAETLRKISAFIGVPRRQAFDISFDRLHALAPDFFRSGPTAETSPNWTPRPSSSLSKCMASH